MEKTLLLGESGLSVEDIVSVATQNRKVALTEETVKRIRRGRDLVEKLAQETQPIYSINTGFGSLKNVQISREDLDKLQLNVIRSHCVGVGPNLSKSVVRAMMALRAHTLSMGRSGVRVEVIHRLLEMLNRDMIPTIPSQGSVGASGDLAPLAHLALAVIGEESVVWEKCQASSKKMHHETVRNCVQLSTKEGLSLINGTQMMTAVGILALRKAENLLRHADIASAMTCEATSGTARAFDERIHAVRPHVGQRIVAENLRRLLVGSEIGKAHEQCGRVQDAYSIRCVPQVHGAARDALAYTRKVLECEINSVTDNPVLFPESDEALSGGNFHGQPVAMAMDFMAIALTSVGSMSERRCYRLLNSSLSGLPSGLIEDAGLQSGLMMAQVTAASLVSECKTFSHPASIDSIPTWADQEDHVSMGAFAARKADHVVEALTDVVGIELLCAAQGLEFRKPLRPSRAMEVALDVIRRVVPFLKEDRVLSHDFSKMRDLVVRESLVSEISHIIGCLQ